MRALEDNFIYSPCTLMAPHYCDRQSPILFANMTASSQRQLMKTICQFRRLLKRRSFEFVYEALVGIMYKSTLCCYRACVHCSLLFLEVFQYICVVTFDIRLELLFTMNYAKIYRRWNPQKIPSSLLRNVMNFAYRTKIK